MIDGMKTGFLLYPGSTDKILPITHINLILGNDGKSVGATFKKWEKIIATIDPGGSVLSCNTKDQLLALDVAILKFGAICYVIEEETYYSYTPTGWKEMETGSNGSGNLDGYAPIRVGPYTQQAYNKLWLDTNSDGIMEGLDVVYLLYSLQNKIKELTTTVTILDKRLKYLEENGVVINPDPPDPGPDPDNPVDDEDDIILLEDGSSLLMENGSELLLEIQVVDSPSTSEDSILMEDGTEILLEDGTLLLMEMQTEIEKPITTENALLFEDGAKILLEDGTTILLEMS